MKKRFRDENGKLALPEREISKLTFEESEKYFSIRCSYMIKNEEFFCIGNDLTLIHFKSWDGKNYFIPISCAGIFLPDVASEGMEIYIYFDTLADAEKYISDHRYFPPCLYIGSILFTREEEYRNTCNELYSSGYGYNFQISYGKYTNPNDCYKANNYNFSKNESL